MASNLDIVDIYTDNVDPNNKVNPKLKGAMWINNTTGETWTCVDNTLNNNVWKRFFLPDKWLNLGTVKGTVNLTINGVNNDYNNFYIILNGSTTFGTITYANAAERSGILAVVNGGTYLTKFFSNAYYSFTVPISTPPQNSNSGQILYFPYKCFPNEIGGYKIAFTRI